MLSCAGFVVVDFDGHPQTACRTKPPVKQPCITEQRKSALKQTTMLKFVFFVSAHSKYEHLQLLSDVVAKEVNLLKVDVPQESGRGWRRTDTEVSTQELGDSWQEDVSRGAKLQETLVKACRS